MRLPNRDNIRVFFRDYLLLSLVFFCIYGGINYVTSIRSSHYSIYFEWESQIPFVPGFIYVYLSVFLVFFLPLFYCSTQQVRAISAAFLVATVFAGTIFLVIPAELYYERPSTVPGHEFVFEWLYRLELPHNLFPSLHVTYTTLFIGVAVREEAIQYTKVALVLWWLLLVASIFLVRQHQVVDAVAGIFLAYLCYRLVYLRITNRQRQ